MANYPEYGKGNTRDGRPFNSNHNYRAGVVQKQLATDRRAQAKVRQDLRASRSPLQQIAKLDARLGKGVGAMKERRKLLHMIHQAQSIPAEPAKGSIKLSKQDRKKLMRAA